MIVTPRLVRSVVADAFGFEPTELAAPGRHAGRCRARQIAMYLTAELCPVSYAELSRTYGRASRWTSQHAENVVAHRMQRHPWWRETVATLRETVRQKVR